MPLAHILKVIKENPVSTGAQYDDPAKIFFTSKFTCLLFCNPTHKAETGTRNMWGSHNSKPPEPIIMLGQ
jgi:hypothetical protein